MAVAPGPTDKPPHDDELLCDEGADGAGAAAGVQCPCGSQNAGPPLPALAVTDCFETWVCFVELAASLFLELAASLSVPPLRGTHCKNAAAPKRSRITFGQITVKDAKILKLVRFCLA